MKFVENIEKDKYEEFVKNHKNSHFMHSINFGEIRKQKNFIPEYVGIEDNNQLLCTALLLKKQLIGKYCYYYVPRGYTIDYNNRELLKLFTTELEKYAKKNHALFIKIDPDIKRHNLDEDGNILEGDNNYSLIDYLKELKYKHLGYNKEFENEQPRFTFRLNIDRPEEEVYANFHATTRKILNKGNKYNINLYKGNINDIEDFYTTMIETAKREGILQANIEYYKNFYSIFNKDNQSDLYISKIDIKDLKNTYLNNINEIKEKIEELRKKDNSKSINKKKEYETQLNHIEKDYEEIKKLKDEKIVLSSIITVKYKDTVWTVHGGNNSILMNLNANYLVYYQIIKDAIQDGYKTVDFFGTCGIANPPKDNPIYGIHSFKKRLGGEYTEFIGEFDLIINKPMYFLFTKLVPIYRNIIKKMTKMKRGQK